MSTLSEFALEWSREFLGEASGSEEFIGEGYEPSQAELIGEEFLGEASEARLKNLVENVQENIDFGIETINFGLGCRTSKARHKNLVKNVQETIDFGLETIDFGLDELERGDGWMDYY
ncbi:unnamed protein product [Calypogeia fissa]